MKKKTECYTTCSQCEKEIIGSTISQVEYNLKIHIDAKHKDHKKIEDKKKEIKNEK